MQDQPATSLSNNTTCKACNALVKSNAQAFCSNCGYPLQGTKAEQQQFIVYREVSQVDFNAHQKRMKQAGKVLFVYCLH
jgi:predicted amidophosphoribosyltransferase